MSDIGNSNRIARAYIDSLRIETRYMDSTHPDLTFSLYGQTFASPIMTAALSHLDHFMFPGAADALAQGAAAAKAALWYGMAEPDEIERLHGAGAGMIEIIKPYADRDLIYQMQGLMREDHRFYKKHGFYDFPQKHKGRIAGMYLVGTMMTNKKLRKKIGTNMTKGMLMPYQKVLDQD